jgi:hypothetical protein
MIDFILIDNSEAKLPQVDLFFEFFPELFVIRFPDDIDESSPSLFNSATFIQSYQSKRHCSLPVASCVKSYPIQWEQNAVLFIDVQEYILHQRPHAPTPAQQPYHWLLFAGLLCNKGSQQPNTSLYIRGRKASQLAGDTNQARHPGLRGDLRFLKDQMLKFFCLPYLLHERGQIQGQAQSVGSSVAPPGFAHFPGSGRVIHDANKVHCRLHKSCTGVFFPRFSRPRTAR